MPRISSCGSAPARSSPPLTRPTSSSSPGCDPGQVVNPFDSHFPYLQKEENNVKQHK